MRRGSSSTSTSGTVPVLLYPTRKKPASGVAPRVMRKEGERRGLRTHMESLYLLPETCSCLTLKSTPIVADVSSSCPGRQPDHDAAGKKRD